ncbi:hypothetical protein C2G38_2251306 [Gigaspora rosea]|uniref:Uncharacterized protein n=1 Tax=Gigaspora rosea TaxID=44941 RepID=A0A397UJA3_9GLOM|nr:hypothetical protein C2G38_2251306 [Gigaspora rosea]
MNHIYEPHPLICMLRLANKRRLNNSNQTRNQLSQDNYYDIQLTASEKLVNKEIKKLIKIIKDLKKKNEILKKKVQEFEKCEQEKRKHQDKHETPSDHQDESETALGSLSVHDCSTEGTLYPQIVREAVGNMFEGLRAQTRAVLEMKLDDIKLLIEADYKRLESLMYDCFSVQLSSTQLLVGQSVDRCLAQICNSELKYGLNVIDRINLQFLVGMSILPRAPNHTKFRVSGHLPLLKTNFSDRKKNNDSIIETVTSSSPKEESPKMDSTEKLSFAKVANDLLKENKNVKGKGESSDEEAPEEHNEEFYDAQDTELSNAKMNQRMFEFEFRVDKFTTTFKQADSNPDKPDVVLVDMVLEHIGLTYVLRPFDMSAEVGYRNVQVDIKYTRVDKKSPEYMSKFEGISQSVDIEMSTKIIVTHTFTTPAAPSSPQSSVETESPILPESQKPQPSQTSTMLVKETFLMAGSNTDESLRQLLTLQGEILYWISKTNLLEEPIRLLLDFGSKFAQMKGLYDSAHGNNSYLTRITAGLQKIRLTSNFTIPKTTALQIHQIINDIDINFNISYAEQVEGLEKRCQELAPLSDELAVITDRVSDSNEIIRTIEDLLEQSRETSRFIQEELSPFKLQTTLGFFLHGVADQHKPTVTTSQKEKPFWCRPIMRPTVTAFTTRFAYGEPFHFTKQVVPAISQREIDSINCPNKDDIPEYEHTMRNVIPFIDAIIRDEPDFHCAVSNQKTLKCDFPSKDLNSSHILIESTLDATATRRNFERDPLERSRIGYKVDAFFKFCGLHRTPEIGSGELRDMWVLAQEQLNGVDASNLVMWGFKVVGRKIRIHALAAAGGFYHLIHEAPMPSSRFDLQNIKVAYCATLGFQEAIDLPSVINTPEKKSDR